MLLSQHQLQKTLKVIAQSFLSSAVTLVESNGFQLVNQKENIVGQICTLLTFQTASNVKYQDSIPLETSWSSKQLQQDAYASQQQSHEPDNDSEEESNTSESSEEEAQQKDEENLGSEQESSQDLLKQEYLQEISSNKDEISDESEPEDNIHNKKQKKRLKKFTHSQRIQILNDALQNGRTKTLEKYSINQVIFRTLMKSLKNDGDYLALIQKQRKRYQLVYKKMRIQGRQKRDKLLTEWLKDKIVKNQRVKRIEILEKLIQIVGKRNKNTTLYWEISKFFLRHPELKKQLVNKKIYVRKVYGKRNTQNPYLDN